MIWFYSVSFPKYCTRWAASLSQQPWCCWVVSISGWCVSVKSCVCFLNVFYTRQIKYGIREWRADYLQLSLDKVSKHPHTVQQMNTKYFLKLQYRCNVKMRSISRHWHTHLQYKHTDAAHIPGRNTYTARQKTHSSSLQLLLHFTLFCSRLQGIISLSNPFPYIKCCFHLRLACSAQRTSCWQHRCFHRKQPSGHGREMEKRERQIPLAPLGRYPCFLFPFFRKIRASFSAFVCGMSLNKTSKSCRHRCLWSYFKHEIRWGSFAYIHSAFGGVY